MAGSSPCRNFITVHVEDRRSSPGPITGANFGAADPVTTPAPSPAGRQESVIVSGLPRETLVYFALKARDERGNVSELSNVVSIATEGIAPADVRGFSASNPTGNSIALSWQPSGDDGTTGNPASYDIRYSTAPITDANFVRATSVIRPATTPKPAMERYTLSGLRPETKYYFAIKARDEVGNTSLINGGVPVTATTLDAAPPAAVSNLAVSGRTAGGLNARAVDASGQSSATTGPTKATDGNPSSYWSSPGRGRPQAEFVTIDLGSVRSIGRVMLRSRAGAPLFPQDLEIQVSNNNQTFSTVARRLDNPATPGALHTFEFNEVNARYVKINATKTRLSAGGLYYAQIAEIDVLEAVTSFQLTLSWTEPGDDGMAGRAASFDVRYSRAPIANEAQFNAATALDGEPAPRGAGTSAKVSFQPLEEGVTLYFRMKTFDDSGNASPLSNQATALVAIIPPAPVKDLRASGATTTSVQLSWTASGDDGPGGTAAAYDIRYAMSAISESNFASADPVAGEPAPAAAGTRQGMEVEGLTPGTTYFFAMRVGDESGTPSVISNVVSAATGAPDTMPPAEVADLRGSPPFTADRIAATAIAASSAASGTTAFANATDGSLPSYWGSAGTGNPTVQWITLDAHAVREIGQVRIRSRSSGTLFPEELEIQVSNDNTSFRTVRTAAGLPATAGLWHSFQFPAVSGRYVRVRATKLRLSAGRLYYAQIAEIELYQASLVSGPVTLSWTAPGDDGDAGTAAAYDLRFSRTPIADLAAFNAATPGAGEPEPQASGKLESFEVNVAPGTWYFALRARDEAGNVSGISNVPVIVVP